MELVQIRLTKHLEPFFGGRRMASITTSDVRAFVAHRQGDPIGVAPSAVEIQRRLGDILRDVLH